MVRSAKKRPVAAYDSYLFEIEGSDPSYSLSTAVGRHEPGIYSEHWHLNLVARCLSPKRLAGRDTRFVFIAKRDYFERPTYVDEDWRPRGVGHLTMRGQQSDFIGGLPFDTAWGVSGSIANGQFKYLILEGERLKRGTAAIRYMAFRARYDPEDYFD